MSVGLAILFLVAAWAATTAIRHAIVDNLDGMVGLHRQAMAGGSRSDIFVTFRDRTRDQMSHPGPAQPRSARSPRRTQPKPVTHRLHHFSRDRSVA